MNTTTHDQQELSRWLDGEMDLAETTRFEARLQANPELKAEAESMRLLCAQVKTHFPRITDVPHPDFFNSQIMERIARLDDATQQKQEQAFPWLRWLHRPWLAFAGALALVLLVAQVVFQTDSEPDNATTLLNTYAPDSQIQPRTYHSNDANATVLELDGVEDIPADSDVVGFKPNHGDFNRWVAQAALKSDPGQALMVVAMNDTDSAPMFVR